MFATVKKLLTGDVFGLTKYFAWGVDAVELEVVTSRQRAEVLEFADAYASRVRPHSRVRTQIVTAVDELLTNAMFHAPVEEDGKRRFGSWPRDREVSLSGAEAVTVGLCTDGTCVGVSVADVHGSLRVDHVRELVRRAMSQRLHVVDLATVGAGIGIIQTVSGASRVVFNVSPGRRTEVLAFYDLLSSYREFANQPKSVVVFTKAAQEMSRR